MMPPVKRQTTEDDLTSHQGHHDDNVLIKPKKVVSIITNINIANTDKTPSKGNVFVIFVLHKNATINKSTNDGIL